MRSPTLHTLSLASAHTHLALTALRGEAAGCQEHSPHLPFPQCLEFRKHKSIVCIVKLAGAHWEGEKGVQVGEGACAELQLQRLLLGPNLLHSFVGLHHVHFLSVHKLRGRQGST